MRQLFVGLAALTLLAAPMSSMAADAKPDADKATAPKSELPPLPEDKSVPQSAVIGGRTINYTATVGTIVVRDAEGKKIGEVVYTAYTVPGGGERPVTFAFNGGPGASSVYLNLGAVGPKRVPFGDEGDAPSDAPVLRDNPNSWLDLTDLVFIDPIGTGFSRSLEDAEKTKKDFYGPEQDIKYLSRVVYDWLTKAGRMRSAKYVMGESYGGYRAPRIANALQTQMGVGVNGVVMVSPYLDPPAIGDDTALSPLPWIINLPSMAAAKLEREGRLSADTIAPVVAYARGAYATDFLAGKSDPEAAKRMAAKVAELTGLDPALVQRLGGRIDINTFLRESHRADGKIGSVYDSNVTAYDPFPTSAERRSGDPILNALLAPTTSAMVDFVTRVVGWKAEGHYEALSFAVNEAWDRKTITDKPVSDLREAMANDPKMKVLIAHGFNDLSCPFMGSRLIIDQLPAFGDANRVHLALYPGGHMFYTRNASGAAFHADAKALYGE
uniref:S10 family peptidase n=2 Tax=Sphingomonas sp. GlSt437 TaxID=3389970 RepID=UPI003A8A7FA4